MSSQPDTSSALVPLSDYLFPLPLQEFGDLFKSGLLDDHGPKTRL